MIAASSLVVSASMDPSPADASGGSSRAGRRWTHILLPPIPSSPLSFSPPRGTIRAAKHDGHARISATGLDEHVLQRLRNAFSVYPASRLRAAPPIARPTLGQLLGIAWLAWLLDARR